MRRVFAFLCVSADTPEGLEDCSKLLKITESLLRKGYKEDDIRKILGGNILRVME